MITIDESQAHQVKYLLEQAIQGNHILFEPQLLKRALARPVPSIEQSYAVEHHVEKLFTLPGLAAKRAYLERLDQETLDVVVKTYFNVVENRLAEDSRKAIH